MTRLINKKPEELTPEELEQHNRIGKFRKPQARMRAMADPMIPGSAVLSWPSGWLVLELSSGDGRLWNDDWSSWPSS